MPIGATIAAVSTVGAAAIGASAAKSAAKTQANAATQASNVQQQMYGQTREDLAPFRAFGSTASGKLSDLLGLTSSNVTAGAPNWDAYLSSNPDVAARAAELQQSGIIGPGGQWATPQDWAAFHYQNSGQAEGRALPTFTASDVANNGNKIQSTLESLPGYQFTRDQGIASVNRVMGSMGQTGAQAKGIARFVTGLADSTYNSQVANLQNATNTGENAAAQTGTIGSVYGGNIGNNIVGAGTAAAAGQVGAANAVSGALGQIPGYLLANQIIGGGGGIYGSLGSNGIAGSASAYSI